VDFVWSAVSLIALSSSVDILFNVCISARKISVGSFDLGATAFTSACGFTAVLADAFVSGAGVAVTSGVNADFNLSVADSKNPFSTGLLASFNSLSDVASLVKLVH
jgi:hypothetical protein